jgi:hypothetical protein
MRLKKLKEKKPNYSKKIQVSGYGWFNALVPS